MAKEKTGWLILTRQLGESILIGDNIVVKVMTIRKDKVRLGIIAPGLEVDREEVRASKLAVRRATR